MSCSRSPPSSPRAPKIQHQSWDDPTIELYSPTENIPPRSPSRFEPPKSPKSPRKFDKKINIYFEPKSPKSPRKFDFSTDQRSPKFDYNDGGDSHPPKSPKLQRTKGQCSSNGSYYNSGGQRSSSNTPTTASSSSSYYDQSMAKSPKSPRKFNYEAISPKYDHKAKNFEHFDTMTPNDERKAFIETPQKSPKQFKKKQCARASSPDNFNYDKRNSVVTESTVSGDSEATTAVCSSGDGGGGGTCNNSGGSEAININERDCDGRWDNRRRRHAINITSNPGYQVLHGSHSTLDRTCSDSVMSIRKCRKSTSDLTEVSEKNVPIAQAATPKRRGSSKGGLAYLASRRGSRDSIKSAVSNASIFSNEDIGPLAFQASSRGRQRRTSNFLELPVPDHVRPRVCSLPERPYNPRQSDDLYRLRTFSISKGTVVNCGDSIISRRSRSNTSVNSTNSRASERSPFDGSCCHFRFNATVDSLPPSPTDSEPPPLPRYRVVLLGDSAVGKTALVSQFMTSEYMHTYDASLDDEFGEKTVSILLDGEESDMIFIDHPSHEMSVENSLSTYEPHGCIVIYSVVARSSFRVAEEIINYLWTENVTRDKSVILVGNKADLARSRVITTAEGKSLAASRDAKFIETSSGIQHNVDELLVGILKQIRLKETRDKKAAVSATKMRNSKTHMSLHLAKEILQKIGISDISKSKSCENLHVL